MQCEDNICSLVVSAAKSTPNPSLLCIYSSDFNLLFLFSLYPFCTQFYLKVDDRMFLTLEVTSCHVPFPSQYQGIVYTEASVKQNKSHLGYCRNHLQHPTNYTVAAVPAGDLELCFKSRQCNYHMLRAVKSRCCWE